MRIWTGGSPPNKRSSGEDFHNNIGLSKNTHPYSIKVLRTEEMIRWRSSLSVRDMI